MPGPEVLESPKEAVVYGFRFRMLALAPRTKQARNRINDSDLKLELSEGLAFGLEVLLLVPGEFCVWSFSGLEVTRFRISS